MFAAAPNLHRDCSTVDCESPLSARRNDQSTLLIAHSFARPFESSLAWELETVYFEPMRVEKLTHTVFTPLDDGTAVLLNLETRFYYTLNRTGAALWQELEHTNPSAIDDLIRVTCDRFDVNEDEARSAVAGFVEQLQDFKMVRLL